MREPAPNPLKNSRCVCAPKSYNHLEMQLGPSSGAKISDGLMAAMVLLSEKPRQGVPSRNPALHPGIDERNSTVALGLRAGEQLNRVRSRYTGKERDTESGNDYFGARYYASTMGRWMSPDPVFASAARVMDPQQWNMYAYARNNPLSITDPTGLDFNLTCTAAADGSNVSTCQGGVQGTTSTDANGKSSFTATDVDMNDPNDAGAGYHDQSGNQYTGTFDQNNGVSFTDANGNTRLNLAAAARSQEFKETSSMLVGRAVHAKAGLSCPDRRTPSATWKVCLISKVAFQRCSMGCLSHIHLLPTNGRAATVDTPMSSRPQVTCGTCILREVLRVLVSPD